MAARASKRQGIKQNGIDIPKFSGGRASRAALRAMLGRVSSRYAAHLLPVALG
jgi:hypothetical protein